MNLSKSQQVVLGIFTFLPFIFLPFIIYNVFGFVMEMIAANEHGEPDAISVFASITSFIMPAILLGFLSLSLLIFYIVHAVGNKKIESVEQLAWVLIFIFFGIVAFPIYWFIRIRNSSDNP